MEEAKENKETEEEFNLRVTEDQMAVLLDCDINIGELDTLVVTIGRKLEELGIKDPPDQKKLKEHLNQAARENPNLVDFVLVKGEPPGEPTHGRVDWEGDFFNTGFVIDNETGKVDYRKRVAQDSVSKGALLGKEIPVKEGKDGKDVFGKLVYAEVAVKYYPKVGENVRLDMVSNSYYAETNGRVRLANDVLSVDEVYTIKEDVDVETGDISHTGAVVVNRDVLNGAKIEAVGNIEVHGTVENAEIRTKGNLTVRGGIRQSEGHKIEVEGSINAMYILGGDIQAKKDVIITREIVNVSLKTLGAVMMPKGRIVGGETVALRGIYVGTSGTKADAPTVLVAGVDFGVRGKRNIRNMKTKRIQREVKQLKNYVETIMAKPGSSSVQSQEVYMEKQAEIVEMEQELQDLIEEEKAVELKNQDRVKKIVVIDEILYPKTTICLDDEKLLVDKEYIGPIQAKIVNGKISLGECDKSTRE